MFVASCFDIDVQRITQVIVPDDVQAIGCPERRDGAWFTVIEDFLELFFRSEFQVPLPFRVDPIDFQ